LKIKKIDDIEIEKSLWWVDYNDFQKIISQATPTITGGVIVYECERDISGVNVTLKTVSGSGWVSKEEKEKLQTLIADSFGKTFTITTIENDDVAVRFRHEVGSAMKFKRVVDALDSEYFEVEIYLARV